ncbi:hypothetical protein GDO81_007265 [Engystomops pustulosus]|uniref:Uncharacterized protein n=1 Tax=Engystomops pustulosus TaxID=76066 RepID=A0AAV7C5S9_ENGPU|nr:hypothetical protein GDO81_007265 [Engystomops pustulosus]
MNVRFVGLYNSYNAASKITNGDPQIIKSFTKNPTHLCSNIFHDSDRSRKTAAFQFFFYIKSLFTRLLNQNPHLMKLQEFFDYLQNEKNTHNYSE